MALDMLGASLKSPPPPAIQSRQVPIPLGGVNAVASLADIPASDCVYAYNLIPGEKGLQSRLGHEEWVTGLTGSATNAVREVLPYAGSVESANKLWAVTSTGLWNVTDSTSAPTQALAFPITSGNAGRGVSCAVVTSAGHFLFYADEANGLHLYDQGLGAWEVITEGAGARQISGINPANIRFVTQWKGRVLLVPADSTDMYYLDTGAVFGVATRFPMAKRFKSGGFLVGLWSWTYDGGAGLDDSLVAIASGGDVAVFQGTDPASATTFGLKGVWNLGGSPPAGRRIATDVGGELAVLSPLGLLPMSRLVSGAAAQDGSVYTTRKIAPTFSRQAALYRSVRGWAMHPHPTDNALIVTVPSEGEDLASTQWAMSFATGGWFQWRDLPIVSGASFGGEFFFGTEDGRICKSANHRDGVTLADGDAAIASQTWTDRGDFNPGANPDRGGVRCCNGVWVAWGKAGALATSEDGISWALASAATAQDYRDCADNGAGTIVLVASGNVLVYSADAGVTWAAATSPLTGGDFNRVRYSTALSLFVALGRESGSNNITMATSANGIAWTSRTTGGDGTDSSTSDLRLAESGGYLMVAGARVGAATGQIIRSTDGIAWTRVTVTGLASTRHLAGNGSGRWVVSGPSTDPAVRYSTDNGATWTSGGTPFAGGPQIGSDMIYAAAAGLFVFCGGLDDAASGGVATSATGASGTWTVQTTGLGANSVKQAIEYRDQIAIVGFGGRLASSTDGATWTYRTPVITENLLRIAGHSDSDVSQLAAYYVTGSIITTNAIEDPSDVSYSLLTAYSAEGSAGKKQVQLIEPSILSDSPSPVVESHALYDLSLIEPAAPTGTAAAGTSAWDVGAWDTAVWGGEQAASMPHHGATGMGRRFAIALRGTAASRTTLVGIDVHYTQGGPL